MLILIKKIAKQIFAHLYQPMWKSVFINLLIKKQRIRKAESDSRRGLYRLFRKSLT